MSVVLLLRGRKRHFPLTSIRKLTKKLQRMMFFFHKILGYGSVADAWKEALEIPYVERKIEELYAELLPFYQLLHGYVRSGLIKS